MEAKPTVPALAASMAALAQGDHRAWSELYTALAPMVAATAMRVLFDPELVQDVVQEVFLDLKRSARRFRAPPEPADADTALRNWVAGITVKTALYLGRSQRNRRRREIRAGAPSRRDPATPAEAVDLRDLISAGLAELPRHLATAVSLRYLEGLSYAEIGASEGISAANAKQRTHRGIQHLRTWCARGGVAAGLALITGTLQAAATEVVPPAVGTALPGATATVPITILHGGLSTMSTIGLAAAGLALATGISLTAGHALTAEEGGATPPEPAAVAAERAAADLQPGDGVVTPVVAGTILAVRQAPDGDRQDLVMISVGKDDDLEEGDSLVVYRDNRYICKVSVERVLNDMAACRVQQDTWNQQGWTIAQGDLVSKRLKK